MRTFPMIMGKSLEFDVLAFSWMSHWLEFVEVVVDVFISTDVKNKQWIIWSDLLYIPSWRVSPKSSWFCKLAVKCLRQHGGRPSRCLAFAVPQWPMKQGCLISCSQSLTFFIVLVQPFQQLAFFFLCRLLGKSWTLWLFLTFPLYIKWPLFSHNLKKICLQTRFIILLVKPD